VNYQLQLGVAGVPNLQYLQFQTATNVSSYRICFHIATTSASAYSIDFNQIVVWPPSTGTIGSIVTDWQSYTPTSPNSAYTLTSSEMFYRRVGGNVELQGQVVYNTTSGTEFRFPLPNGISVSSTYTSAKSVGKASAWSANVTYKEFTLKANGGDAYLTMGVVGESAGSGNISTNLNANDYSTLAGFKMTFDVSVPIQGWGSSVAFAPTVGDGRIIGAIYKNQASSSDTSYGFQYTTQLLDTHGAVSTQTSGGNTRTIFTAPAYGLYSVKATVVFNQTGTVALYKYTVSTGTTALYSYIGNYNSAAGLDNLATGDIVLNAGDYIYITTTGVYTSSGNSNNVFSVFQVNSGNQAITNGETVSASYYRSSTTTFTNQINFDTKVYDTHNAVTTGASWKFTAPVSGIYSLTGHIVGSVNININLWKNNSNYITTITYLDGAGNGPVSSVISLLAGEYIDLRPGTAGSTIYGGVLTTQYTSQFQITRVGNYAA